MYWKVGEFLSKEMEHASYGDAYIDEISSDIYGNVFVKKIASINNSKRWSVLESEIKWQT